MWIWNVSEWYNDQSFKERSQTLMTLMKMYFSVFPYTLTQPHKVPIDITACMFYLPQNFLPFSWPLISWMGFLCFALGCESSAAFSSSSTDSPNYFLASLGLLFNQVFLPSIYWFWEIDPFSHFYFSFFEHQIMSENTK